MSRVGALTRWTGWDARSGTTPDASRAAAGLVEGPGAVTRYELLALAGRGFRPPGFLTVRDDPDEGPDPDPHEDAALRRVWSLEYRVLAETRPHAAAPFAIYLLGVDPPAPVTDAELEEFNDFYTNVHLVEVAERRHALRAVRFELARVVDPVPKGAPRFLATYEVDEAGAAQRRHVGPPYSRGPDVWQRHTTPWRLWYRRLSA